MNALFDSHTHLQDRKFRGEVDAAVERARKAGVAAMVVLGYDPPSNVAALEIATRHPGRVFPAVGIHPHDAAAVSDGDLAEVARLARLDEVVAVGEIGLDFYRDLSPRERQREVLQFHLDLALALGKPVSVHSRSAETTIAEPLLPYAAAWRARYPGRAPGVMHCFGGSANEAAIFVEAGFLVSVACTVTYPSNSVGREVAATVPLESLLVETDAPYLPPQERRGKRNEPAFVGAAAEAIAELRGLPVEAVARATTRNAARLFGVTVAEQEPAVSR